MVTVAPQANTPMLGIRRRRQDRRPIPALAPAAPEAARAACHVIALTVGVDAAPGAAVRHASTASPGRPRRPHPAQAAGSAREPPALTYPEAPYADVPYHPTDPALPVLAVPPGEHPPAAPGAPVAVCGAPAAPSPPLSTVIVPFVSVNVPPVAKTP